jgi:hypothetical protein
VTTNYTNTFITVAPDSAAKAGQRPAKAETIAGMQYSLLQETPYKLTSDDLLFEVHARRNAIADADRAHERQAFLAKPQACLRTSPLVKQHGWGLHHDAQGRVAMYAVETEDYARLAARTDVKVVAGMRSRKG